MARIIRDQRSKQRIVEAAWRLIAADGARSTTMRAIAAEAGVTTGSVTHYFEDKAQIMAAVLEHNNALALHRVHESSRALRGLAAARAHALALVPTDAAGMSVWRVWLAFWTDRALPGLEDRELRRGWDDWRRGVHDRLREAVSDGELPGDLDLGYEADRIGTLIAGVGLVFGASARNRKRIPARARRMLDQHLAALVSRRA